MTKKDENAWGAFEETGPIKYDPAVIQQSAKRLYSYANQIIVSYCFIGLFFGGFIGTFFDDWQPIASICLAGFLGSIGIAIGNEKAFQYKLQAQTALCQAQIEENIRLLAEKNNTEQTGISALRAIR